MLSQRSSSSTVASIRCGSFLSRSSCSGWRSRASVPRESMLEVVSCPANSSSPPIPTSSSVVRSSPCSRTSMPSSSSPGSCWMRATSPSMYERCWNWSIIRSSPGTLMSSILFVRCWKSSRSSYGTPSSSQITSAGIGSANDGTRSTGDPAASMASRWSFTMASMRGSRRRMRRMVNSGVSIRRSRVCSGGSRPSRLPARTLASCSSVIGGAPGSRAMVCGATLNRSASPSTSRTSAYRVTSQASAPNAVCTLLTRSSSRAAANSGAGSNSTRRMCSGIVEVSLMQSPGWSRFLACTLLIGTPGSLEAIFNRCAVVPESMPH